ncbi:MAG: ABC transporter [Planctomycetes bacterium]|jgi:ABC-2 type transport system ATP-binding protein|nr:ABC transporter [Planctomycetota bacterium]
MIEVQQLTKDYGFFRAVDNISFAVQPGEAVGFLGPNGAGKTTTIRVLTGYHPATSGVVRVHGHDVLADSLLVRAALGYLPENVPIYPDLRVEEYLRFRAALKGVPRREIRSRVAETMDLAGVVEVRRKLVGQLSRGYRQRVGLADALISRPPLLVLDEPTSGLDPNQRRRVREFVRDLKGRHTILFSSHILSDVEEICDRIVLIHHGKLRAEGRLEDLARDLGVAELRMRVAVPESDVGELLAGLPILGQPATSVAGANLVQIRCAIAPDDAQNEDDLLGECYRRVRTRGLELRELSLHKPSLEELFWQLTADTERVAESGEGLPGDAA